MPQTARPGIKGFIETSFLDWPGQIASVIFLGGCNFRCPFCHNAALVLNPGQLPDQDWTHIEPYLAALAGWADGVVLTGGEPTLHQDLEGLIAGIRALKLGVKLDTNGSRPQVVKDLVTRGLVQAVAMDVKAPPTPTAYARATGQPNLLPQVIESIQYLKTAPLPVTFRTTFVPTLHTEEDLVAIGQYLGPDEEWVIQNFQPQATLDPEFSKIRPLTDPEFQALTQRVKEAAGFKPRFPIPNLGV